MATVKFLATKLQLAYGHSVIHKRFKKLIHNRMKSYAQHQLPFQIQFYGDRKFGFKKTINFLKLFISKKNHQSKKIKLCRFQMSPLPAHCYIVFVDIKLVKNMSQSKNK